jgi:hypothetical protein
MSTAVIAVSGVLAPLQAFFRWLLSGLSPSQTAKQPHRSGERKTGGQMNAGSISCARLHGPNNSTPARLRPLRVVRVMEAGQAPATVGRMLISGRMADVCAELDRLAAREAALS